MKKRENNQIIEGAEKENREKKNPHILYKNNTARMKMEKKIQRNEC